MGMSRSARLLKVALLSRGLLLVLTVCFQSAATSYDTSSTLHSPCLGSNNTLHAGPLDSYITWDSVHFVRIADCGYEYERSFAFFPALPFSMHVLASTCLRPLVVLIGWRGTLWLGGVLLSNAAFVAAALYLYRLGLAVVRDEKLAYSAALLFCWNPASAFYTTAYTESLFALVSFAGLYYLVTGKRWLSLILLAASTAVRSNGILYAYFFLFDSLCSATVVFKRNSGRVNQVVFELVKGLLRSALVLTPFALFQAYGYQQVCIKGEHPQAWCNKTVPYIYGYVQDRYWNVGFLRYFQLKQLPNFLLAAPMLGLSIGAVLCYARHNPPRFLCTHLWPIVMIPSHRSFKKREEAPSEIPQRGSYATTASVRSGRLGTVESAQKMGFGSAQIGGHEGGTRPAEETGFFSPGVLCFTHHLALMVFIATLIMHVQVATRFLSASPAVYWYAARLCAQPAQAKKLTRKATWDQRCFFNSLHLWIWGTFTAYAVIGTLLFTNFYPFT